MLRTIGSVLLVGLLAASLAFLISRRSATRLTRPIQDLQQEANAIAGGNYDRQVDLSGTDEIALLAADFDAMRRRVKEYTERLHEMVEEKVREIRDILDNVGQGLFTVTFEGHVNPDYAATTNGILGVGDVARCTVRDLFRLDEAAFGDWMDWLEMAHMRHGKMSWEKLARLCPVRELAIVGGSGGVRHIQVGYQPMLDGQGNPAKLMVLVQDVTESRRIEAVMRAEKEKHEEEVRGILGIVNNGAMVPKFLQDVEAKQARLLTACRGWGAGNPREEELEAALRDLHTLKGSAATYGFVALERAARRAELAAAALRTSEQQHPGGAGELLVILEGELRQAVDGAKGLARRLSGLGDDPSVPVPERKLRGMQDLARQIPQGGAVPWERLDGLLAACRTLDHVRLSVPGERYRSMITRLSARLGKAVEFHVRPEAMEVSPRVLAQLDEPLVHILRNSLDHGLEQRAERTAAGKPEAGRIELTLERKPEGLAVRVEDDGKGIDTAKVAERAVASGAASAELVAAMTDAEKARLILLPGLTTRERGDDLSGLGVGMDAVAAWATARGGSLDLSTLPGRGTRIDIRLPPDFDAQV
jgi:two-component system chemotaxis sensor kinase CheA